MAKLSAYRQVEKARMERIREYSEDGITKKEKSLIAICERKNGKIVVLKRLLVYNPEFRRPFDHGWKKWLQSSQLSVEQVIDYLKNKGYCLIPSRW